MNFCHQVDKELKILMKKSTITKTSVTISYQLTLPRRRFHRELTKRLSNVQVFIKKANITLI